MVDSRRSGPKYPILLRARDHAEPATLLAEDVTFSSPFADYHGRPDVCHLFSLIARVLTEPAIIGSATDGVWTYTSLTARADAHELEAVLRERHDADGRLLHATLFLRPYRSLRAAMDAMGRLLAETPLPSAR
jgi:hypothetical protein